MTTRNAFEALAMARAYVQKPGNSVGGNLHIVLEDTNLKDEHVEFCLAQAVRRGDDDGAALARVLIQLTEAERQVVNEECWTA